MSLFLTFLLLTGGVSTALEKSVYKWDIPTVEDLAQYRQTYSPTRIRSMKTRFSYSLLPRVIDETDVDIRLNEWLGGGSYGDVFNCSIGPYPYLTAKLIKGRKTNERAVELMNEAAIQNEFGVHPNVLPVAMISYSEVNKVIMYTPFMPKKDLNTYMKDMKNRNKQINGARIAREIIDGLHHIHKIGYVHNDMYAKNIFVSENDTVAIADFGLAEMLNFTLRIRDIRMTIRFIKKLELASSIENEIVREMFEKVIDKCDHVEEEIHECQTEYLSEQFFNIEEDAQDAREDKYMHDRKTQVRTFSSDSHCLQASLPLLFLLSLGIFLL